MLKITFCLSTDASVIDTWNARRNRSEMAMVIDAVESKIFFYWNSFTVPGFFMPVHPHTHTRVCTLGLLGTIYVRQAYVGYL